MIVVATFVTGSVGMLCYAILTSMRSMSFR
jgi:hypothetical protein